jgi:hypothetical protein
VLKALALAGRSEPKDAYNLVYILRYYAGGVEALAAEVREDADPPEMTGPWQMPIPSWWRGRP